MMDLSFQYPLILYYTVIYCIILLYYCYYTVILVKCIFVRFNVESYLSYVKLIKKLEL